MLFGVISFPGTNCETESLRALKKVGFDAKILRWNEPKESFLACDGLLLAGGFSYEDRGRSGVIAANDQVMDTMREMAKSGKLIIGICNGAQILVESGLITDSEKPTIALSINKRVKDEEVQGTGFYHDWCYLKNVAKKGRSPFNNFEGIIKMPLAHGEGRFVIPSDVLEEMKKNDQIVFLYTDEKGSVNEHYPINPNGSIENIAGLSNKAGNVLAMMPHPERGGVEAEAFFQGLATHIANNKYQISLETSGYSPVPQSEIDIQPKKEYSLEFYIESIITDNDCETIRLALEKKIGESVSLKRLRYFGMNLSSQNLLEEAVKIVESDEIANTNKERVYIQIAGEAYIYVKGKGLQKAEIPFSGTKLYAIEKEDILSSAKLPKLKHSGISVIEVHSAICWIVFPSLEIKVIETGILANPVSMRIEK